MYVIDGYKQNMWVLAILVSISFYYTCIILIQSDDKMTIR